MLQTARANGSNRQQLSVFEVDGVALHSETSPRSFGIDGQLSLTSRLYRSASVQNSRLACEKILPPRTGLTLSY